MPGWKDHDDYLAYHREYKRKQHVQFREFMDALKDEPCADCGNRFPPECMDFDHVRGKKLFNIGHSMTKKLSVVLAEVEKCDLVCANCHRIRTKARGYKHARKGGE